MTASPRLEDQEVSAVGSRQQAVADRFADEFDILRRHGSYASLAADPTVDALYVATPHSFHLEHTLLALHHGKHVLCEKPFAINAGQAQVMVDEARARGLFLMEAMWMRFLPDHGGGAGLVAEGAIGAVRMVQADFGFRAAFNPAHRLFDPALGGGALLDVGIYPLSFASMILGEPAQFASVAELGATGIDEQTAIVLGYPGGKLALLSTAVCTRRPTRRRSWARPARSASTARGGCRTATVLYAGAGPETIERPVHRERIQLRGGRGRNVPACRTDGERRHAAGRERGIMATMDVIRRQWGMSYPME